MIVLNTRDPKPIYEQITNNLRRLIASGGIAPGERLPSVRELATRLTINPNTIQRAYRQLEQEGYIVSLPGKGCFAAEGSAPPAGQAPDALAPAGGRGGRAASGRHLSAGADLPSRRKEPRR